MPNRMIKWFDHKHLSPHLASISEECGDLARSMDEALAESAEKTAGMRKLLEAKDCFVRAMLESSDNFDAPKTEG